MLCTMLILRKLFCVFWFIIDNHYYCPLCVNDSNITCRDSLLDVLNCTSNENLKSRPKSDKKINAYIILMECLYNRHSIPSIFVWNSMFSSKKRRFSQTFSGFGVKQTIFTHAITSDFYVSNRFDMTNWIGQ